MFYKLKDPKEKKTQTNYHWYNWMVWKSKCTLKMPEKSMCMFLIRNNDSWTVLTSRIICSFVPSTWQVLMLDTLLAEFLQAFSFKLNAITLRSPVYTSWILSRATANTRQISNQCSQLLCLENMESNWHIYLIKGYAINWR